MSTADGGNLYLPATGLDGDSEVCSPPMQRRQPKLNKLGAAGVAQDQDQGVRAAVDEVAKDLVRAVCGAPERAGLPVSEKIRSGSGSLKKCSRLRKRRIS